MNILYIAYTDFAPTQVGASMRPQKMYRAFVDEGHKVKLLCGRQGTLRSEERARRAAEVKKISAWLDTERPDLCYIESPVYPILWEFDRALIRKIRRLGIPIGYFYRDFYRRFPDLYPGRSDPVGRIKEKGLDILQDTTDRLLKKADIVYFPSMSAAALFDYRDKRALPPAGELREATALPRDNTCIYVGGMGGHYGGENLLKAFHILNAEGSYPLLLVCRQNEWASVPAELKTGSWLEVHHTSGDGLTPLYRRSELAVLPIEKTAYTDTAVNIKFFEYMSYGLPVASTDVAAVADLVRKNDIGRVGGDTPEEIAENIRAMLSDTEGIERWHHNALRSMAEGNLWIHRARQVVRELSEKRR